VAKYSKGFLHLITKFFLHLVIMMINNISYFSQWLWFTFCLYFSTFSRCIVSCIFRNPCHSYLVHSSVPAPLHPFIDHLAGGYSSQWDVKFSLRREPHANARSINQFVLPINTTKYGQRSLPIMINGFTSLVFLLLQSIWLYVILSLYIFTRPNEFN